MVPVDALLSGFVAADESNAGHTGDEGVRVFDRPLGSGLAGKGLWSRNRSLHVHVHRLLVRFQETNLSDGTPPTAALWSSIALGIESK